MFVVGHLASSFSTVSLYHFPDRTSLRDVLVGWKGVNQGLTSKDPSGKVTAGLMTRFSGCMSGTFVSRDNMSL
jgi:hypothetical protein